MDAKSDDKDKCKFLSQQFTLKRFNLLQDREKFSETTYMNKIKFGTVNFTATAAVRLLRTDKKNCAIVVEFSAFAVVSF